MAQLYGELRDRAGTSTDLLELALSLAFVLDADSAACCGGIGGHDCLS